MKGETIATIVNLFCGAGIMFVSYNAYISPTFENFKMVQNFFLIFIIIGFFVTLLLLMSLISNREKKAVVE